MKPRLLSPLERWYWIADQFAPLNVCVYFRIEGTALDAPMREALDDVQRRHPMLRVGVQTDEDGKNPKFVPSARRVPIREVWAEAGDDERWVAEINEREVVEPLDLVEGPLLRLTVIRHAAMPYTDLIITTSHLIADGKAAFSVMRDLVLALVSGGRADLAEVQDEDWRPVEDFLPSQYSTESALNEKRARDARELLELRPARFVPSAIVPHRLRRTQFLQYSIGGVDLAEFRAACRSAGTTVNGAFLAALASAVAEESGDAPQRVIIGSPVDLRPYLGADVHQDALRAFVATLGTVVEVAQDPWDCARGAVADLAERCRRGDQFSGIFELASLVPQGAADAEPLLDWLDKEGPINIAVSNAGVFDIPDVVNPDSGEIVLRVLDMRGVGGLSVVGSCVFGIATCQGTMRISVCYVEQALSAERACALAERALSFINDMVREQQQKGR